MENIIDVTLKYEISDIGNIISNFYKMLDIQKINGGYPVIGKVDYSKADIVKTIKIRYNGAIYNTAIFDMNLYNKLDKNSIYDLCKEKCKYYIKI